jgi:hypothetical protein
MSIFAYVPLRLGANWGYWPSDPVFDQGGGVHHKLLLFLTWMGSFASKRGSDGNQTHNLPIMMSPRPRHPSDAGSAHPSSVRPFFWHWPENDEVVHFHFIICSKSTQSCTLASLAFLVFVFGFSLAWQYLTYNLNFPVILQVLSL